MLIIPCIACDAPARRVLCSTLPIAARVAVCADHDNHEDSIPMPRIGPQMIEVVGYVARHPRCVKSHASRAVGPHGSLNYGWRTVQRAIAAGLVGQELYRGRLLLTLTALGRAVNSEACLAG